MILSDLRRCIADKRVMSLDALAKQFQRSPEVISGMLEHWLRKGNIRILTPKSDCAALPCGSCKGCGIGEQQESQVFYQAC